MPRACSLPCLLPTQKGNALACALAAASAAQNHLPVPRCKYEINPTRTLAATSAARPRCAASALSTSSSDCSCVARWAAAASAVCRLPSSSRRPASALACARADTCSRGGPRIHGRAWLYSGCNGQTCASGKGRGRCQAGAASGCEQASRRPQGRAAHACLCAVLEREQEREGRQCTAGKQASKLGRVQQQASARARAGKQVSECASKEQRGQGMCV